MKKIEAYLKPFRVPEVRHALAEARFDVIRVLDAEEIRPAEPHVELVQGMEYRVDAVPMALLVILVEDGDVARAIDVLQSSGRTDHDRDGRILVTDVEQIATVDPSEPRSDDREPGAHATG